MNEDVRKEIVKNVMVPPPHGDLNIYDWIELFDHFMFHRRLRSLCEHDLGIKMLFFFHISLNVNV